MYVLYRPPEGQREGVRLRGGVVLGQREEAAQAAPALPGRGGRGREDRREELPAGHQDRQGLRSELSAGQDRRRAQAAQEARGRLRGAGRGNPRPGHGQGHQARFASQPASCARRFLPAGDVLPERGVHLAAHVQAHRGTGLEGEGHGLLLCVARSSGGGGAGVRHNLAVVVLQEPGVARVRLQPGRHGPSPGELRFGGLAGEQDAPAAEALPRQRDGRGHAAQPCRRDQVDRRRRLHVHPRPGVLQRREHRAAQAGKHRLHHAPALRSQGREGIDLGDERQHNERGQRTDVQGRGISRGRGGAGDRRGEAQGIRPLQQEEGVGGASDVLPSPARHRAGAGGHDRLSGQSDADLQGRRRTVRMLLRVHGAGPRPAPETSAECDSAGGEPLRQDDPALVQGGRLGRCAFALPSEGRGGEAVRPAQERAGAAAVTHPEDRLVARPAVHLLRGVADPGASDEPGQGGGPAGPPVGGRHALRDVEAQGGQHRRALDADRGDEKGKDAAGEVEDPGSCRS